ncbi:MAG: DNA polymerase III subunit delta [Flavobacteriales bacterium]|nr:DNA polymerase III subunit delta [Flavobacteriales bacterium]
MDHQRILRDIESRNVAPVYVLMGDEPYFVDQITDAFEDRFLTDEEKGFNLSIAYGRDSTMEQIISVSRGFPMIGEKQLVIVKEAQDLNEWKKSDNLVLLEHYLNQPQPSTVLVFAFKNKKLDSRLKVAKQLAKVGVVFKSEKIKENKLPEWIDHEVRSKGYTIEPQACMLLAQYLGTDLSKLINALSKLMIVIPSGTPITTAAIEKNIGISKDYNVFELQGALARLDVVKSNEIIAYFAANPKANPLQMVLPVLYSFFSRLLIYQSLKDRSQSNLASKMGLSPWALDDYHAAARNMDPRKTERIISYLRKTHAQLYGRNNFGITEEFLMKELVFKIIH